MMKDRRRLGERRLRRGIEGGVVAQDLFFCPSVCESLLARAVLLFRDWAGLSFDVTRNGTLLIVAATRRIAGVCGQATSPLLKA